MSLTITHNYASSNHNEQVSFPINLSSRTLSLASHTPTRYSRGRRNELSQSPPPPRNAYMKTPLRLGIVGMRSERSTIMSVSLSWWVPPPPLPPPPPLCPSHIWARATFYCGFSCRPTPPPYLLIEQQTESDYQYIPYYYDYYSISTAADERHGVACRAEDPTWWVFSSSSCSCFFSYIHTVQATAVIMTLYSYKKKKKRKKRVDITTIVQ